MVLQEELALYMHLFLFCYTIFGIDTYAGNPGQWRDAYVIMLDIAKFPSIGIMPFCIPISNV